MSNNLPDNKKLLSQQNIYTTQQNPKEPAKRPRNVQQDKGAFTNAPHEAGQPDPLTQGSRASGMNNNEVRAQKTNSTQVKLVHSTFHLHPLVRAELERIAERAHLSLSQVGNIACTQYVQTSLERQHATTLRTELRQIIREELQVFGHRIVFFLMRIAFSAEQARILGTNVLKLVVRLTGGDQKSYYSLVDESAKLARRNIIAKTPQLKMLLEEWDKSVRKEEKEVKTT
jgi:hypothetical protein